MNAQEKLREELKRERMWNPAERWRVIQDTITWAEAQATVGRNLAANRLREQDEKLRWLAPH
jgi:hypothetical protein